MMDKLKELRHEISQIKATKIYSTIDIKDMILAIIDKYIKELENENKTRTEN